MSRPQDLTFFHQLAQQGNLAATARELGITPSAISKRLTALEKRLGVRLVNRTTRSLGLTPEGELYFRHAGRILGDIEAVEDMVASRRSQPKGLLRINASLGFGRRYIGPALAAFIDRYPEVETQLLLSDHPMELAAHGLDLGIRFGVAPDAGYHARRIASNRRLLCASPLYLERYGAPQRLQDLATHNCIFLRQNDSIHGVWEFLEGSRTRSIKVRSNLSCNDGEVALNCGHSRAAASCFGRNGTSPATCVAGGYVGFWRTPDRLRQMFMRSIPNTITYRPRCATSSTSWWNAFSVSTTSKTRPAKSTDRSQLCAACHSRPISRAVRSSSPSAWARASSRLSGPGTRLKAAARPC